MVTASAGAFSGTGRGAQPNPRNGRGTPLVDFAPPADWSPLDAAIDRVAPSGALVFTSPRAAESLRCSTQRNAAESGQPGEARPRWRASDPGRLPRFTVRWGGFVTRWREAGDSSVRQRRSPGQCSREKVSGPVLFPCGEAHRDELPAELRQSGITVDEIVCYRSVLAEESEARVAASRGSCTHSLSPARASPICLRVPVLAITRPEAPRRRAGDRQHRPAPPAGGRLHAVASRPLLPVPACLCHPIAARKSLTW